jgi:hypothetical protein
LTVARRRSPPLVELDSSNWLSLTEAHAARSKQVGSGDFAARDLTKQMREGRIHSMLLRYRSRRVGEEGPPAPERTLLSEEFWRDHELYAGDKLLVIALPRKTHQVVGLRDLVFYVWLPDYEKIFGALHAKSSTPAQMQKVPEKRGRKAILPWTKIGFELVRRVEKMGNAAGNKTTNSWATELEQWCLNHNQKVPVNSELRAFIDDVLRALRIQRK